MKTPRLLRVKCKGRPDRAYASFDGKVTWYGNCGKGKDIPDEIEAEFKRDLAKWSTEGHVSVTKNAVVTVAVLIESFLTDLEKRYKGREWEGRNCGIVSEYSQAFKKHLIPLYGDIPVKQFSPDNLLTIRQLMCDDGLYLNTINKRLHYIKQAFKHGLPKRWIDGNQYLELEAIERIQENTYGVPTRKKKPAVRIEHVEKTLKELPYMYRDMVLVQIAGGGMRGQDVRLMRLCDINRETEDAWVYIPHRHKKWV